MGLFEGPKARPIGS